MASATFMMFAPGCLCTWRMTAGLPLYHPAICSFSSPSTASPMSLNRTGEPLR